MLLDVATFRRRTSYELDRLVDDLSKETRRSSPSERAAWRSSLPALADVLASPSLGDFHIRVGEPGDLMVEYRLPASPCFADAILLGRGSQGPAVVIVELKDWNLAQDRPGDRPAIVRRGDRDVLHPSDQVKGYVEYCRRFHDAVQDASATVDGCVFFTYASSADAYLEPPHTALASEYPVFARNADDVESRFPAYLAGRLAAPDRAFARAFDAGRYRQDRGFVLQISKAIERSTERPFVLLDEQRRGFELCMDTIERRLKPARTSVRKRTGKSVVVVEGPPGSGKSAIAAQLWAELAGDDGIDGNVVLTTTSTAQRTNWEELFHRVAGARSARGVVIGANQYNPGLNQKWLASEREAGRETTIATWRSNLERHRHGVDRLKCEDDQFAVSIVDEAHALIDPTVEGRAGMAASGWMLHAGPQAWHVQRASKVSVFLLDPDQSYRDNETTTVDRLREFADEHGADFTRISLAGSQFRCGGSTEYLEWVDRSLGLERSEGTSGGDAPRMTWHRELGGPYGMSVCDTPFELDRRLRDHASDGSTVRLLASYSRPWRTKGVMRPHRLSPEQSDFAIDVPTKDGLRTWSRVWNYTPGGDYSIFIQAPTGSAIAKDQLCEVGCPYVVRGFDFDYVGLLWMSDLVWRGDRWQVDLEHVHESAWRLATSAAKRGDPGGRDAVVDRLRRGYRILLSRAMRGTYIWFEDAETRSHVESLLAGAMRLRATEADDRAAGR
jgi:hypothetical protein